MLLFLELLAFYLRIVSLPSLLFVISIFLWGYSCTGLQFQSILSSSHLFSSLRKCFSSNCIVSWRTVSDFNFVVLLLLYLLGVYLQFSLFLGVLFLISIFLSSFFCTCLVFIFKFYYF